MTIHIDVVSSKDGAGCSTVAALLARKLATIGTTALIDWDPTHEMPYVLGTFPIEDEPVLVADNLWLARPDTLFNVDTHGTQMFAVHDLGANVRQHSFDHHLVVVARLCYLQLRRLVDANLSSGLTSTAVVLREAGRALVSEDIAAVLGTNETVVVDLDPAIARAVDAGLLLKSTIDVRLNVDKYVPSGGAT